MLTRFLSMSVAKSLQAIPGAASSHPGISKGTGSWITLGGMSKASLLASRSHRELDGLSKSVGHQAKDRITGRIASNSCRQSEHIEIWIATAAISEAGSPCSAYKDKDS
jgi:hypothetical protein